MPMSLPRLGAVCFAAAIAAPAPAASTDAAIAPRVDGPVSHHQISDSAPDDRDSHIARMPVLSIVPLAIAGLGLIVVAALRRRHIPAA